MPLFSKRASRNKSFKTRVADFWEWFPTVANRFYATIEEGRCPDLGPEVSQQMELILPHLAWVFGPGVGNGHSFTVSGDGIVAKQLLAEYWLSQAPEIEGWTFYGSRQPSSSDDLAGMAISLGDGQQIDVEHLMVSTSVDEEQQVVHLEAWHEAMQQVPEEHRMQILFLLLDEALGEFGTETWLGSIEISPNLDMATAKSLLQLPDFLSQVENYYQWKKPSPLRSISTYQMQEQHNGPRGDTFVGSTVISSVVFEFLESGGRGFENPLDGTGGELAYLILENRIFPDGQEADVRGNIEDAIGEALESQASGRSLGGAFGYNQSYIDLLLLDGEESRSIVDKTLESLQLTSESTWGKFA